MTRKEFLKHAALLSAGAAGLPAVARSLSMYPNNRTEPVVNASMWIYLWDIADEDYEPVFNTLRDHGLTSLSVAAAYHAGKFLAPHNPKKKVVFLEDGALYFKPSKKKFGTVEPITSRLVSEGHSIQSLIPRARKAGLGVRAWVVCCHNTPLAKAYPSLACRNAFGDTIYHNLCPSNDAVREYVRGVVTDLAHLGAERIELEALQFQGHSHGFHHEREGIELSAASKFLMGLCFCPSCAERAKQAGAPFDEMREYTKKTLEEAFAKPDSPSLPKDIAALDRALVDAFNAWRKNVVVSFVEELHDAVGKSDTLLRPMVSIFPASRFISAVSASEIAAVAGGFLTPSYTRTGEELRPLLGDLLAAAGTGEVISGMQVGMPESGGKDEFLDRMRVARSMGVRNFNFYNYGFIPLSRLAWIKKAIA